MTPSQQYDFVAQYWETDGRACADCPNCHTWREGHGEVMQECDVMEDSQHPRECPALNEVWDENVDYGEETLPANPQKGEGK